jgi:MinD superfamily P-loop ATPase
LDNTEKIEQYCKKNNIDIVGKLPYDTVVTDAMVHEKNVIEYSKGCFSNIIIDMWNNIGGILEE